MDSLGYGSTHAPGQGSDKPAPFEKSATDSLMRWQLHQETIDSFPKEQWKSGASYRWTKEAIKATEFLAETEKVSKLEIPSLVFQAEKDHWVKPEAQISYVTSR